VKCSVGLMILCIHRLPEDCSLVPKHVGLILLMNCVSWFIFYYILLSAFVGQYTEYKKMQGPSNIKFVFIVLMSGNSPCNNTSFGSCVFGQVCCFTFSTKHVSTRFTLFSHHISKYRLLAGCFDKKQLAAQPEGTQVMWH